MNPEHIFSKAKSSRALLAGLALLLSALAVAGDFSGLALSADRRVLEIVAADGSRIPAPGLPDQVEFAQPRLSSDGRLAGWLALLPNCCTSYAVPMQLVVMDRGQRLHTFDGGGMAVFSWCFLPDAKSVAYMSTVLHGTNFERFERRSIADGRLLATYEYPDDVAENARARKRAPAWVRCVPE